MSREAASPVTPPLFSVAAPLIVIGAGEMASALIAGWVMATPSLFSPETGALVVVARHAERRTALALYPAIKAVASVAELADVPASATVLLAVKPQQIKELMDELLPQLAHWQGTMISIAAGLPLAFYETALGAQRPIIRTMPNLPATIGCGVTAAIANAAAPAEAVNRASVLFRAVGDIVWLNHESEMHVATALAGCGSAYLFYFMQCLSDAAITLGMEEQAADQITRATIAGAAQLAAQSDRSLSQLREAITSRGGVTEAALKELMAPHSGIAPILQRVLNAAHARSQEMQQQAG